MGYTYILNASKDKNIIYAPNDGLYGNKEITGLEKPELSSDHFINQCKEYIQTHEATDIIDLKEKDIMTLNELWNPVYNEFSEEEVEEFGNKIGFVPSDIIFANTIPIQDMVLNIYEGKRKHISSRVIVFEDYKNAISLMDESVNFITFGVIVFSLNPFSKKFLCMNIAAKTSSNSIAISEIYLLECTKADEKLFLEKWLVQDIIITAVNILNAWYGVQVSLLHPLVKEYVQKGTKEKKIDSLWETKSKTRKQKYIKRHIINTDEFENIVFTKENTESSSEERTIIRKTLLWRVIGHWRSYKNGKTVFIQPYWKGPARTSIKEIQEHEPNQRELVINK